MILGLQCLLHLLVFARCSLVFDEANQEAQKNKYCSKVADCMPGTHVMCMYGDQRLGPRCNDGRKLGFNDSEKTRILDILNQFKRNLAQGREKFPKAYGMRKLFWDHNLAEFAQAWANQCYGRRLDGCRASEQFPRTYQLVTTRIFSTPDWLSDWEVFQDKSPNLTLEKRLSTIETFTETIYKSMDEIEITNQTIEKFPSGGYDSPYLAAIYAKGMKIGCGMTTYLNYYRKETDAILFNILQIVCNLSTQPIPGEKVYDTKWVDGADWTPCGCPRDFYEEDCLCIKGERPKPRSEKPTTEKPEVIVLPTIEPVTDDNDHVEPLNIDDNNSKKQNSEKDIATDPCAADNPNYSPRIVLMPIITVDNAGQTRLHETEKAALAQERQKRRKQLRQEIKDRVKNVRDRYFKDYTVLDPGTKFFEGEPIAEDAFVLTKNYPKHTATNNNKESKNVRTNKRSYIDIKSRRDFSNLDDLLSEYYLNLNNKEGLASTTDVTYQPINERRTIDKSENTQNSQIARSPNLKDMLKDLYDSEQILKDLTVNSNKVDTSKIHNDIVDNSRYLQKQNNQMPKSNLMDNKDLTDYSIDDLSNADHDQNMNNEEENIWLKRNQNPLNTPDYDTKDFDYHFPENYQGYGNIDPQSMLIVNDYNEFQNEEKPASDQGQNMPFAYDANEITKFYLDKLDATAGRPRADVGFESGHKQNDGLLIHPNKKSSKVQQQHSVEGDDSELENYKQRYFMPDRLNL